MLQIHLNINGRETRNENLLKESQNLAAAKRVIANIAGKPDKLAAKSKWEK